MIIKTSNIAKYACIIFYIVNSNAATAQLRGQELIDRQVPEKSDEDNAFWERNLAKAGKDGIDISRRKPKPEEPSFSLGNITYSGSGCPPNSVEVVLSPDASAVSILFSEFIAETNDTKKHVRAKCDLAIEVNVSGKKSIGIFQADYRGYTLVPPDSGSYSTFNVETFFEGSKVGDVSETFQDYDDLFFISNIVTSDAEMEWCECGASDVFQINSEMIANKEKLENEDVFITLDTTDVTVSPLQYYIKAKDC